jgi:hypothetical protein
MTILLGLSWRLASLFDLYESLHKFVQLWEHHFSEQAGRSGITENSGRVVRDIEISGFRKWQPKFDDKFWR